MEKKIKIILVIVIVLVVSAIIYFIVKKKKDTSFTPTLDINSNSVKPSTSNIPNLSTPPISSNVMGKRAYSKINNLPMLKLDSPSQFQIPRMFQQGNYIGVIEKQEGAYTFVSTSSGSGKVPTAGIEIR